MQRPSWRALRSERFSAEMHTLDESSLIKNYAYTYLFANAYSSLSPLIHHFFFFFFFVGFFLAPRSSAPAFSFVASDVCAADRRSAVPRSLAMLNCHPRQPRHLSHHLIVRLCSARALCAAKASFIFVFTIISMSTCPTTAEE